MSWGPTRDTPAAHFPSLALLAPSAEVQLGFKDLSRTRLAILEAKAGADAAGIEKEVIVLREPSGDATGTDESPKVAARKAMSGRPSAVTQCWQRQSSPTPVSRTGRFGRK